MTVPHAYVNGERTPKDQISSPYYDQNSNQPKYLTLTDAGTKRVNAELLAFVKAQQTLEKNCKINSILSVKNMTEGKRKACLADLVEYQTRKEYLYKIIIVYWLGTIVMGLLAMTIKERISETGMYVVWTGLLLSNFLLVLGHKTYDHNRVAIIVRKYSDDATVVVNPINSAA